MSPLRLDQAAPGFEKEFSAFLGRNRDSDENVDRIAAEIVADVRARGDLALAEYTRKFDKVEGALRITDAERDSAAAKVPPAGTCCPGAVTFTAGAPAVDVAVAALPTGAGLAKATTGVVGPAAAGCAGRVPGACWLGGVGKSAVPPMT